MTTARFSTRPFTLNILLILPVAMLFVGTTAFATLGESEASIDSDATALHGTHLTTSVNGQIRARQLKTTKAVIKQYTNASGQVYALSWQGVKHPDLSVLMGAYFPEYSSALKARGSSSLRRNSTVTTSQAVIHLSGVPRHMSGLVYVPALLPSEVKTGDLR